MAMLLPDVFPWLVNLFVDTLYKLCWLGLCPCRSERRLELAADVHIGMNLEMMCMVVLLRKANE